MSCLTKYISQYHLENKSHSDRGEKGHYSVFLVRRIISAANKGQKGLQFNIQMSMLEYNVKKWRILYIVELWV